jgi:hypothetical protein
MWTKQLRWYYITNIFTSFSTDQIRLKKISMRDSRRDRFGTKQKEYPSKRLPRLSDDALKWIISILPDYDKLPEANDGGQEVRRVAMTNICEEYHQIFGDGRTRKQISKIMDNARRRTRPVTPASLPVSDFFAGVDALWEDLAYDKFDFEVEWSVPSGFFEAVGEDEDGGWLDCERCDQRCL